MEHDDLKEQAEELAKGKKTADLARLAFIYAYISNHEVRMVWERLGTVEKIIWRVGAGIIGGIVVGLVLAILKLFVGG